MWVQPLQPLIQKKGKQLQPPLSLSADPLCHPCITTIHLSYRILYLKLPTPLCAVRLVMVNNCLKWLVILGGNHGDIGSPFPRENVKRLQKDMIQWKIHNLHKFGPL